MSLVKLSQQLTRIGYRTETASRTWSWHTAKMRSECDSIEQAYQILLKQNAWATAQYCSATLARLQRVTAHLQLRIMALGAYQEHFENVDSVQDRIARYMAGPIGPETRAWQVICAIVEAEMELEEERRAIQHAEDDLSQRLEGLADFHRNIVEKTRCEEVIGYYTLKDVVASRTMVDADDAWDQDHRAELDALVLDAAEVFRKVEGSDRSLVEGGILHLMFFMAKTGIRMARQTLITEYFRPVRSIEHDHDGVDWSMGTQEDVEAEGE